MKIIILNCFEKNSNTLKEKKKWLDILLMNNRLINGFETQSFKTLFPRRLK